MNSLTTSITLTAEQVYALSYALSVAMLTAKATNDSRLLSALQSIDEIAEDRISALG